MKTKEELNAMLRPKKMKEWIMPKKILAFDLETTGIGEKYGLVQFAAIAYIDGKKKGSLNIQIKPFKDDLVDMKALAVNNIDITKGLNPFDGYEKIVEFLDSFISKFERSDKFTPLAMNGNFDLDHMIYFFNKNNDKYFGSYQNFNLLDPLPFLRVLRYLEIIDLKNLKLSTICEAFGIEIKAHDALSDIEATVQLSKLIFSYMKNFTF